MYQCYPIGSLDGPVWVLHAAVLCSTGIAATAAFLVFTCKQDSTCVMLQAIHSMLTGV